MAPPGSKLFSSNGVRIACGRLTDIRQIFSRPYKFNAIAESAVSLPMPACRLCDRTAVHHPKFRKAAIRLVIGRPTWRGKRDHSRPSTGRRHKCHDGATRNYRSANALFGPGTPLPGDRLAHSTDRPYRSHPSAWSSRKTSQLSQKPPTLGSPPLIIRLLTPSRRSSV